MQLVAGWALGKATGEERGAALLHMMAVQTRAALGGQMSLPGIAVGQGGDELATVRIEGRWVVAAADGDIHNAAEILGDGWDCPSNAAQIALKAYLNHGEGFAAKLRGAFSVAIWDGGKQTLLLARDPLGLRPLFYAHDQRGVRFSSALDALLVAPGVSRELTPQGAARLMAFGPARMPGETPINGVHEVKAGTVMRFSKGRSPREVRFWRLTAQRFDGDADVAAIAILDILSDAVRTQTSDWPVALLSGGLDSSLLCALAAPRYRACGKRLSTRTIQYANHGGFEGDDYLLTDDLPFVKIMADYLDTEHQTVSITAEDLAAALGDALRARCLPGMADIDASLLLLMKGLNAKAALLGEGADEIFGGYPWFHRDELLRLPVFPWSGDMLLRQSLLHPSLRSEIDLPTVAASQYHELLDEADVLPYETGADRLRRQLQHVCLSTFGANLIERADRMGGFSNVSPLMPFLDERLVSLCYSLPWQILNLDGHEKGVLRLAARNLLPPEILHRKKSPFPRISSSAYPELARRKLLSVLSNPDAPLHKLIDTSFALQLAQPNQPASSSAPWFGQLMRTPQLCAYLWQINEWLLRADVDIRV